MKQIQKDIKEHNIGKLYLLYGEEDYLRKKFRDDLKMAVIGEEPSMNYAYYEGKGVSAEEVIAFADTMPFLAEKRMVIVENCNLNTEGNDDWIKYLENISDTCCVVLVEKSMDKRSRVYKKCKEHGYVVDLDLQKGTALLSWIKRWLVDNQCAMDDDTLRYFLERVSNHMNVIETELEKLRSYKMNPTLEYGPGHLENEIIITRDDVEELTTETIENKIFQMIEAAAQGDQKVAFELYYDLLSLKEAPMKILILLTRQINALLVIKDGQRLGQESGEVAKAAGVPPFAVKKNAYAAKSISYAKLKECLAFGVQMEEDIKRGRIKDTMAVELLLTKCCQ